MSFALPPFGGIGAAFKILDIQQYASGFKLGPAARVPAKPLGEDGILNQNPIFEMGSIKTLCKNRAKAIMASFHRFIKDK